MIDTLGRAFIRTGQHLGMTSVKENEPANGAQEASMQESSGDLEIKRKWRLEKRLGDGAFSAVWLAVSINDSEPSATGARAGARTTSRVALKLLPRHLTSTNERTHISFLREVEVLSSIRHPNVVGFVDDFETQGYYALALETAEGGELFECVQSKAWAALVRPSVGGSRTQVDAKVGTGERLVHRIMKELCSAVGFLHEVGIVHRDIKLESEYNVQL
jgi:tRNA (cytidine32/guanosine34-2'-O)-methyltransferase